MMDQLTLASAPQQRGLVCGVMRDHEWELSVPPLGLLAASGRRDAKEIDVTRIVRAVCDEVSP